MAFLLQCFPLPNYQHAIKNTIVIFLFFGDSEKKSIALNFSENKISTNAYVYYISGIILNLT
jgi:hypothetical protein